MNIFLLRFSNRRLKKPPAIAFLSSYPLLIHQIIFQWKGEKDPDKLLISKFFRFTPKSIKLWSKLNAAFPQCLGNPV